MSALKQIFTSTKKQLALTFSVAASILMVVATVLNMLLISWQMRQEAQQSLAASLASVSADFQANQLEEKSIAYQGKESAAPASSEVANIFDINRMARQEKTVGEFEQKGDKDKQDLDQAQSQGLLVVDEAAFAELKDNRQVYSRVILANGDILFSSDLFDTLSVNHQQTGFHQYTLEGVCIYTQTEKIISGQHSGATIQVGKYCPFTVGQQRKLVLIMAGATLIAMILSYGLGLFLANKFLQPLQELATHTKVFAQNVYHELFTPLSVALTSVAAALSGKEYLAGLQSVNQDLEAMQQSLDNLSKQVFADQAKYSKQAINLHKLILTVIAELKEKQNKPDLNIFLATSSKQIIKKANETSFKLIVKNLLTNALKYSKANSRVDIKLTEQYLSVSNQVSKAEEIDIKQFFCKYYRGKNGDKKHGKGLGLALVKELVDLQGWQVKASLQGKLIELKVIF